MSAIVGFFGLDGRPAAAGDIESMSAALAHRGPDGSAVWIRGPVGLGHCALHTTQESRTECLPLERDGSAITADARVDNREELISALGIDSHRAAEITDSEIILSAYAKWGEDCPSKLLGDFCFAIWDQRNRRLFCARDHFGVKPFYYCHSPGQVFAFASEIKALRCLPEVPNRLNEGRVADYLLSVPGDKAVTFFQDIRRLPPAHSLRITFDGLGLKNYWALDPSRELRFSSEQEYAAAYLDTFSTAVRRRVRSAFPIGSALSGGLDSSSIVCLARECLHQEGKPDLKTFSGVFDDVPDSDERPYIASVTQQGGIEAHFVRADQISPLAEWERILWHLEEPIWTPNLFMHWALYTAAHQQNVRIFLDGFLGDNVVGHGWEHLMDLAYDWRWISLLNEVMGVARRQVGFPLGRTFWQYLWEYGLRPRIPRLTREDGGRSARPVHSDNRAAPGIDPDFAKRTNIQERYAARQAPDSFPPGAARKRHYRDLGGGEIPLGLEASNKAASAFSIEPRFPFADRQLAEFCLAVPPSQRIEDGRSRMIVRRALANYLPEQIRWRAGKGDLSHNFRKSLLNFEEERLDQIFFGNSQSIEPYFEISMLRRTYQQYKKHPETGNIQAIWSAANLALWLEHATQCDKLASTPERAPV